MTRMPCRKFCLAIIACLFVLTPYITLYALSSSGEPSSSVEPTIEQPLENSSFPVTIRVETDKSRYALGEIVQFKIFLVNNGPDTLKIGPVNYGYRVYDSEGKGLIRLSSGVLYASELPFALPPYGEILLTDLMGWGQQSVRREGSALVTRSVTSGTYTILVDIGGAIQATAKVIVTIGGG